MADASGDRPTSAGTKKREDRQWAFNLRSRRGKEGIAPSAKNVAVVQKPGRGTGDLKGEP